MFYKFIYAMIGLRLDRAVFKCGETRMEEENRDPRRFLRELSQQKDEKRGKLKIFFGYAAGVGKTYAMLEAAHQAQQDGVDVAVGYVERHARPETLALLEGLEQLPCLQVAYKGIELQEFDLDGALARRPQLILIDELAHTNAPGCRHTKRYQDVEELLKAGIHVYTTVNVQHLESLNDLVESITGIAVSERIPDQVFDAADQVELVDIEPADLVKRLQQGKIYRQGQAQRALGNFFTGENLAALREIALRRTADRLNRTAQRSGKEHAARAGEHILICLSPAPSNAKVIRTAARMAEAFHSGFTALLVQTTEIQELSGQSAKRLRENMRLAEQLGAQIATVYGDNPAVQIAEYARVSGVTKIVMGRVNHRQGLLGQKSLADQLIERAGNLDVYIIPDQQPRYKRGWSRRQLGREAFTFRWRDVGKMLLVLSLATVLGFLFERTMFSDSNIITVYILGVLVTAVWTSGYLYGAVSALLSVAAFNYFFIPPQLSFDVTDPGYPVTFLIMLIASILVASLASRVKRQARQAAQKAYYTELLLGSSQKLQRGKDEWEVLQIMAGQLSRLLDRPILYAPVEKEQDLQFRVEPEAQAGRMAEYRTGEEQGVARWVVRNNKHAGATTDTLPNAHGLYLSVRGTQGGMAVVGIPIHGYPLPEPFEKNLMVAMLNECGLILERRHLQAEKQAIEMETQQERLRANLLRAISHDLRTPLTSISGNAGVLMEKRITLDEAKKQELYAAIYDDSMWLVNLTENLLSVTRLDNGAMKIRMEPELLEEVFQEALGHLDRQAGNHQICTELDDDLLMAQMDVRLIVQVIINIVNNAVKYTQDGSRIVLRAARAGEMVEISISDDGPGISDEAKPHLFDMFYTASQGRADSRRGLGLGLSLCQSIVAAHGGTISVGDCVPHGTVFRFTLPIAEVREHGES